MRAHVVAARIGRLATVTADGRPHVVPCCFAVIGATIVSAVDGKAKSTLALRRLENVRTNPHASLLVDHYSDDWSTLWWVRVDGPARVIEGGAERDVGSRRVAGEIRAIPDDPAAGRRDRPRSRPVARLALTRTMRR